MYRYGPNGSGVPNIQIVLSLLAITFPLSDGSGVMDMMTGKRMTGLSYKQFKAESVGHCVMFCLGEIHEAVSFCDSRSECLCLKNEGLLSSETGCSVVMKVCFYIYFHLSILVNFLS